MNPLQTPGSDAESRPSRDPPRTTRRQWLRYGLGATAGVAAVGGLAYCTQWWLHSAAAKISAAQVGSDVFHGDAPRGELWELWRKRGWVREASHYLKLGGNVLCQLCPNECLLEPGDRSHCRNRVNQDGTLYTLTYGNPCSFNLFEADPIEKKPLFHFLPGTRTYSLACSGCVFRCLNCQNWDISQRKPEETKDPRGEALRLTPERLAMLRPADIYRVSMFPEDVVALAEFHGAPSIAYTYSEPIAWYEYVLDTCRLARQKGIRNVWVTCGSIQEEPLLELCQVMDAASVNLKSFSEAVYQKLNAGRLEPILRTLKLLKRQGVWFEVINLIVPTYTDDLEMIGRMCDWLVEHLGPDCPLHFSRFHPDHKLMHLPPTPLETLLEAREVAQKRGLHYVYIGNVHELDDAETTYCPGCRKPVIQRDGFAVRMLNLQAGRCAECDTPIAGVWTTEAAPG